LIQGPHLPFVFRYKILFSHLPELSQKEDAKRRGKAYDHNILLRALIYRCLVAAVELCVAYPEEQSGRDLHGYCVGFAGDKALPGDYDGGGRTDIAVWRPSAGSWYFLESSSRGSYIRPQWGLESDVPVPADYDADGIVDIGVWRDSSGVWYHSA
jgi:hypothetical protein